MKWVIRTAVIMTGIAALVLCVGLAFTGMPTQAKYLPTGQGISHGSGHNVLLKSRVSTGSQVANGWLKAYSTTAVPTYERRDNSIKITYTGSSSDTGTHRRIAIFRASWHAPRPGQRWQFSIRMSGQISRDYVVVGIEWIGGTTAPYRYISEQDVYPRIAINWQHVTVITPPLPKSVKTVTAYIQIPEINPMSRIDARFADPSLALSSQT
jgi:hypothetical protein